MLQIEKRDGSLVSFDPKKILNRIKKSSRGLKVNDTEIFVKVITSIPTEGIISTKELDKLVAEISSSYTATHPDYSKLASNVAISSYHKETKDSFVETMNELAMEGIVNEKLIEIIDVYGSENIENTLKLEKDYNFNYFAWKALQEMYLLRNTKGKILERPQHMYMRIALWVTNSFPEAVEYYNLLSDQLISPATPIMINSGTKIPQLASCFEENTNIYIQDKGLIKIKDVEINDIVITHKNNLKKVTNKFINELNDRKLIDFKCYKTPRIVCTDDHKFFSITREQIRWGYKDGQWNSIENLRIGDYVKGCYNSQNLIQKDIIDLASILDIFNIDFEFTILDNTIEIKRKWEQKLPNCDKVVTKYRDCTTIKRYLVIDNTFAKFLGIWYGDGSLRRRRGKNYLRAINIVAHIKNTHIDSFLKETIKEYFGLDLFIHTTQKTSRKTGHKSEWNSYTIHSVILATIFEKLFGAYFYGKRINERIYKWDKNLIKNLLGGLITSDGCVTKRGGLLLSMKNENFIKNLYIILRKHGYIVGIKRSSKKTNKTSYHLLISQPGNFKEEIIQKYDDERILNINSTDNYNTILINNEIYYKITEKKLYTERIQKVYNLEIEDDNSYCVEGLIAKNCVLTFNEEDSREGLLNTIHDISVYSADAAGIGLCMSNIRSKETKISTSGGNAGGLLKYLKIINESLRFFNQQGRRPGSCAVYLEPWHKDVFDLLDIKKQTGAEEMRARDIFTALWIPDNFMRAVKDDMDWYLFCPHDIKKAGLKPFYEIYGEEYETEYQKAIDLGIGKKVKAQDVWKKIYESQVETGVPYILFKDSINKKTNHQNIGVVSMSNLCSEILEYTDKDTTAICTLSSQVLKNYVKDKKFDFDLLHDTTRNIVRSLNKVIDINSYSTKKGKKGGLEQRAIAIGVQGFADLVFLLDLVYTSTESKELDKNIWETIYHAALTESCELVKTGNNEKYKYFDGSPYSKGIFQFEMWGLKDEDLSGMWDWKHLRKEIIQYGLCNSLFTAAMPTASSSRVTDSFEMNQLPDSNIFVRKITGGEFIIVNQYLVEDFEKLGIWGDELKNEIILNNGSIQNINFNKYLDSEDKNYNKKVKRIEYLIQKYRTVWEIPQKEVIDMAANRGIFVDQTQSMNIYMSNPTLSKMTSALFHAWQKGLKTGNYYLRTKAISTGAKHLALDLSKNIEYNSKTVEELEEEIELQKKINEEIKNNVIVKPSNSTVDCFGCSS